MFPNIIECITMYKVLAMYIFFARAVLDNIISVKKNNFNVIIVWVILTEIILVHTIINTHVDFFIKIF